jgi:hypothetical protein
VPLTAPGLMQLQPLVVVPVLLISSPAPCPAACGSPSTPITPPAPCCWPAWPLAVAIWQWPRCCRHPPAPRSAASSCRCPAPHPLARHRQHRRLAGARAGGPQAEGLWDLGVAVVAAFWPFDSPFRVVPAAGRDGSLGLGAVSGRWARSCFRRVALAAVRAGDTRFAAGTRVLLMIG